MPRVETFLRTSYKASVTTQDQVDLRTAIEMGMKAHRSKDYAQAERIYRSILNSQPNQPDALHGLGLIGLAAGDPLGALHFVERAAALAPKSGQPMLTLGQIYRMLGWQEEAVVAIKKASDLMPAGTGELHMLLGQAQLDARQSEEALRTFGVAAALRPEDSAAHAARGLALERLGQSKEAIEMVRAAFRDVEQRGEPLPMTLVVAFVNAAIDAGVEDEAIELVERACEDIDPPAAGVAEFALKTVAKIYDKRGDVDKAWSYIVRGNTTRPAKWAAQDHEKHVADKLESYSPERLGGLAKTKIAAEHPVFIVGLPRSGTTLIEQIIHAHPKGHGCGELTDIWSRTVQLQTMYRDRSFGPSFVDQVTTRSLEISANDHLRRLRKRAPSADRIVDKMPANFLNLGLIWQMFPSARVIHCTRNPLDTCFSTYATPFTGDFVYRRDLGALVHYYGQYRRLMEGWAHMFDGRLIEVNYEAVVHDQEGESRKIMDFLELPWDDAVLRYWEAERVVRTASEKQVREPIYTSSIGRAKAFEAHLGPLIEGLAPWMPA